MLLFMAFRLTTLMPIACTGLFLCAMGAVFVVHGSMPETAVECGRVRALGARWFLRVLLFPRPVFGGVLQFLRVTSRRNVLLHCLVPPVFMFDILRSLLCAVGCPWYTLLSAVPPKTRQGGIRRLCVSLA